MKKLYTMLAVAATGLSAMAAPQSSATLAKDAQLSQLNTNMTVSVQQTSQAKPMKIERLSKTPIRSVADFVGPYQMKYEHYMFNGDDRFEGVMSPYFSQGATADEIIITGMPYSDVDIKAYVNMEKKTFTIPAGQELLVIPGQGTMVFRVMKLSDPDAEGRMTWEWNNNGIVMNFDENGFLDVESGVSGWRETVNSREAFMLMDGNSETSGWGGWAGLTMSQFKFFDFKANEWTSAGTATVGDGVFCHFIQNMEPGFETAGLSVYTKAGGWVAVEGPYTKGEWANLNDRVALGKTDPGYLVFNIANPDCVYMLMGTGSGFWMDDPDGAMEFYPWNQEGQAIQMKDYEPEDVIEEYMAVEMECSNYDEASTTVNLVNIWFGDDMDPAGQYGFAKSKNPDGSVAEWYDLFYTIVAPGLSGVKDVEFDSNAPVKYFNLQGMEVVNPAKGQVVIKTQGNKAQKLVIK